jgi:hypothetical protein
VLHQKIAFALSALVATASGFTPIMAPNSGLSSTALFDGPKIGAGGMADTRDPAAMQHEDPRKSISEAPSFEEYLKMRSGGGAPAPAQAAPAPAPAAYAPPAPAPAAYAPPPAAPPAPAAHAGPKIGAGGMADTRDPAAMRHEDPRKSISEAPSFEEYLKMRSGGGAAAPAAAPAAPAPAAYAPPAAAAPAPAAAAPATAGGGTVVDTLSSLQGPGQVWGAEGIAVGKEESDLKGYDNFDLFLARLQSTGVAQELAGAGPYTIFAPVNSAVETYEMMRGPMDAQAVKMQILPSLVASSAVSSADLTSLGGPLKYRYAVRKHFVNDAIIGEKTFGPYDDFPIDVQCSNGVIHAVGLCFAM